MPDASCEDIEQFFADAGWAYHRLEGDDWETRYSGAYTNQVITVRMTQYWVYFYATLINRIEESCRNKMFEHLALLNYKVSFGKFSLDKSNRICLGVEVPRENLQSSVFKDSLNALSYLIDEHFRELLNLATDPEYVSKLKLEQDGQTTTPPATTTPSTSGDTADEDVDWGDEVEVVDAPTPEGSSDTAPASDSEEIATSDEGSETAASDGDSGLIIPLPPPPYPPQVVPSPAPPDTGETPARDDGGEASGATGESATPSE